MSHPTVQVDFHGSFCAPLAGTGVLTTNAKDSALNRPVLPAMCEWIREGWSGLRQGLGVYAGGVPESDLFSPPPMMPWDDGVFSPFWSPRFPFAGPSEYEWTPIETPWPGGTLGLPAPKLGSPWARDLFEYVIDDSGAYWVTLDDQDVYVLVRRQSTDFYSFGGGLVGFSPSDAAAIGIAWKLMRATLANIQGWWDAVVSQQVGSPKVPLGTPLPQIFDGSTSLIPLLTQRALGLASSREVLAPQDPVFIYEDPYFTAGGAGNGGVSRSIVFKPGHARGGEAPMHQLATLGITNWAQLRFPQQMYPQYPVVAQTNARAAGRHLAWLAGVLAHELLHQTWNVDVGYWRGWHSDQHAWCKGPTMDVSNSGSPANRLLRDYEFPPAASVATRARASFDDAVRESVPAQGIRATKHFVTYLVGDIVWGLLMNDVGWVVDWQHSDWCNRCDQYSTLNGCGP